MLIIGAIALLVHGLGAAAGLACSEDSPRFYEANGYTVRRVELRSPFDFLMVRRSLDAIAAALTLRAGDRFSVDQYTASLTIVEKAIRDQRSYGKEPPVTVVVITPRFENCDASSAAPALDVVYHVLSTDPLRAVEVMPRDRAPAVESTPPTLARKSLTPPLDVRPSVTYDHERNVFGQLDLVRALPLRLFDTVSASVGGSTSSSLVDVHAERFAMIHRPALDRLEYEVRGFYTQAPSADLTLMNAAVHARITAAAAPITTARSSTVVRYGALIEAGHQDGGAAAAAAPADTAASSSTAGLRAYAGLTRTTRYTETAISYGVQAGGTSFGDVGFAKQVGDLGYALRFPAGSHAQWDLSARIGGGHIAGDGPIPIVDRFFGGATVAPFIPGDAWRIPGGPLIRSIATNLLNGSGFGGTSFYAINLTVGRTLIGWPIIPDEIEHASGFDGGINAAERTAENWFADDYEASSPEFTRVLATYPSLLDADVASVQAAFTAIRTAGGIGAALDTALRNGERQARLARNLVANVQEPHARGSDSATKLRAWPLPQSRFVQLVDAVARIEPDVPAGIAAGLKTSRSAIGDHLAQLQSAIDAIHGGPVRAAAERRAAEDMRRPREVIDTLRHEANAFAVGLTGVFDAGRLWPDPDGTHYGIGGGVRFQIVNTNFTVGYVVNPNPRADLGQGRGEWLLSVSYTNLFR